ncbi:Non-specific serine/threonine protein kinase [Bertholletia excelsa]
MSQHGGCHSCRHRWSFTIRTVSDPSVQCSTFAATSASSQMSATSGVSTPSPPPPTSSSSPLAAHASRNSTLPYATSPTSPSSLLAVPSVTSRTSPSPPTPTPPPLPNSSSSSSPAPGSGSSARLPPAVFPSPTSPLPSPGVVVGIVIGVVAALAFLGLLVFYGYKNRRRCHNCYVSQPPSRPPRGNESLSFSKRPLAFTYEELAAATDNFLNDNLLGQGGFGYVHKGVLQNGTEVAVKQLKAGSRQGDREFKAEVEIISRVHHRHLVSLVGYCVTGSQRMLVYEFVPNNTLEFHLHGRPAMDWPTRLKVALGVAKGLAYLHEDCHPKIIHRDIKAANILLDSNFEAMVADFGLAKFFPDTNTHVSTKLAGTFGYLAPEYASSGKLTEKSDVFSFGVILLELVTGRQPTDSSPSFKDGGLADWARPLLSRALEDENFGTLVDPRLQMSYNHDEMVRMVACAASCVHHSARQRPTMSQVVRALEGNLSLSVLTEGVSAARSRSFGCHDCLGGKDVEMFRRMVFRNGESGNAECSKPTNE